MANHDHSGDAGYGGTFDAANLTSGAAPDGQVLTADGAGGTAWEALSALANHDHSGDAGDGGAFDAANLASGAASDGQVLTADGAGGTAWEALPALANHDHSGDGGDGGAFPADNLASGLASANKVLTADGYGQTIWQYPTTQAHDHSGDAGDGGAFDAANLASGVASDGQVLTADGAGGSAWEALPALVNHDHSGDAGDGGVFDAANLTSGAASDGQVLTADGAGGAAWASPAGDVLWAAIQAAQWCNEIKGFPSLVGMDIDLDAAGQWWDKIGTPTTPVMQVDIAGEGITETWEYALGTVADANGEGFYQRYTYADELRIKAGRRLSAMAAVYVGTPGRIVTMALTTSASSTVAATATAQAWTILACENLTLNGSYVDLRFTISGAGAFYVVPLGVNIGAKAAPLPPRGMVYRECVGATALISGVDPGGAGYTDLDCTAYSSALACKLNLWGLYKNTTRADANLSIRRNGDTTPAGYTAICRTQNTTSFSAGTMVVLCDDGQIIEWTTNCAAADTENLYIKLLGWWEWA